MTTPLALPAAARRTPASRATALPAVDVPVARRILGQAALLGTAADALLRTSLVGAALPVWVALVALAFVALAWSAGRRVTREAAGWLLAAIGFAATTAWREADMLQACGLLATIGSLLMAAIAMHDGTAALLATRLRDLLWAARGILLRALPGWLPLAFHEAIIPGETRHASRRAAPAVRGALLATALVLVFGSLLRGADPIFASLVSLPDLEAGELLSHLLLVAFFGWLVSGWARAALDDATPSAPPDSAPLSLGATELTTSLGALNALFALYVLTQLGWFFGGERFLHERTGLTAATYAREGFFEMTWVVLLVVPLLLATRALLPPGRALARRHTMLATPLVVMLGAMILSAAARMRLYVHYYGLTTERVYPIAFMGWLAFVVLWLALTVLRGRGERFVAGAVLSAGLVLVALDVVVPDVVVARVNIARSAGAAPTDTSRALDLRTLAWLSGEAVPYAVSATLSASPAGDATTAALMVSAGGAESWRCTAAKTLLERWGPGSELADKVRQDGAWRRWNRGQATALATVATSAPALRAVQRSACGRVVGATPAAGAVR